jgi:RNA polymerase sigma factor (sigma-70 family)
MTEQARALVLAHDCLARQAARRFAPGARRLGLDVQDLIQIGRVGLCKAAAQWDPEAHPGVPFECYARLLVRGACLDAVKYLRPAEQLLGEPLAEAVDLDALVDGRTVMRAARALPARERACLLGWAWDVYGYAIASRLGFRSPTRVSQLRARAVALLQERLV